MHQLLEEPIREILTTYNRRPVVECERALRVGAAMLGRAPASEITATTVVCDVARLEMDAVESLVDKIADEYRLDASIQQHLPTVSVRFSRRRQPQVVDSVSSSKPLLARLLRW